MKKEKDHISVCVCTFKRPHLLGRLLRLLAGQIADGLFDISIVVVDNDRNESAKQVALQAAKTVKPPVSYYTEAVQNIARARNKAIDMSKGNIIAFIDDDEFPSRTWLMTLYRAYKLFKVDGILGPVLPHYEERPASWIIKGRFFERPRPKTGTVLKWHETRTGNVLIRKGVFEKAGIKFDPKFGSGGEDRNFFKRAIEQGHTFIWCEDAFVWESIPAKRCRRKFLVKRALLRGQVAFTTSEIRTIEVFKSFLAVGFYSMSLFTLLFIQHHLFMTYLIKNFDHIGKISIILRIPLIKEKYVLA